MCVCVCVLSYITNSPTCFGASAQFSGNFDIVFAKTIKCQSQWPRGLRRGPAEIMGSNPTGGMDICLL